MKLQFRKKTDPEPMKMIACDGSEYRLLPGKGWLEVQITEKRRRSNLQLLADSYENDRGTDEGPHFGGRWSEVYAELVRQENEHFAKEGQR